MNYSAYPEYKSSSTDWLGDVPAHWDVLSIKRLTPVSRGASPRPIEDPKYFDDEGEYAWVRIADVTSNDHYLRDSTQRLSDLGKALSVPLEPGSLFLSIAGSVGKPMITAIKACIHDGFVYFPHLQINNEFLYYIFDSGQPYLGLGKLGTQLNLNTDTVGSIKIGLPPRDEQDAIAAFLDWKTGQIDALIAKKKELLEKLKEKRLAVITQAVTKGLNPAAPLRDSGIPWLGQVPEHWGVRRLKFTASEPLMYGANEAAELDDPEFPRYIRITDVKEDGTLHDDTFRSLPPDVAEPYLLKDGDILLARSGATVGKSFQYLGTWGRAAYAGYLIRLRVDTNVVNARFAYFFMQSDLYWACINSTLIQATIQNFSADKYDNINVPIPPLDEQMKIVDQIEKQKSEIDKQEAATAQAIVYLTEYRTALITAATTGKIDVRNVAIPVLGH